MYIARRLGMNEMTSAPRAHQHPAPAPRPRRRLAAAARATPLRAGGARAPARSATAEDLATINRRSRRRRAVRRARAGARECARARAGAARAARGRAARWHAGRVGGRGLRHVRAQGVPPAPHALAGDAVACLERHAPAEGHTASRVAPVLTRSRTRPALSAPARSPLALALRSGRVRARARGRRAECAR